MLFKKETLQLEDRLLGLLESVEHIKSRAAKTKDDGVIEIADAQCDALIEAFAKANADKFIVDTNIKQYKNPVRQRVVEDEGDEE